MKWENESYDVDRPNPFDYNPSCLHVCKGVKFEIIAHGPCNIYIQKTLNEKDLPEQDVQAGRHRYLGTRQQGRADGLHQARCTHLLRP
ncbi:5-deoxy-glucuronate isomerase [Agathobaculum butyriciproducens]|uniref:5-deoxy-glucuronate isomerase n=1 Tax=Agathobaculum butyriciproducens TaxID=1628085 RepID=UPI0036D39AB4